MLTIVMCHRVRELKRSRYPEIKGLELSHHVMLISTGSVRRGF